MPRPDDAEVSTIERRDPDRGGAEDEPGQSGGATVGAHGIPFPGRWPGLLGVVVRPWPRSARER
jgi:hypothetical protein